MNRTKLLVVIVALSLGATAGITISSTLIDENITRIIKYVEQRNNNYDKLVDILR